MTSTNTRIELGKSYPRGNNRCKPQFKRTKGHANNLKRAGSSHRFAGLLAPALVLAALTPQPLSPRERGAMITPLIPQGEGLGVRAISSRICLSDQPSRSELKIGIKNSVTCHQSDCED